MIRVLLLEPDPWRHRGLASVLIDSGTIEVSPERDYSRILSLTTASADLKPDVVGVAHRLILEHDIAIIPLMCDLFDPCSLIVHGELETVEIAAQVYAAGAKGYFVLSHPPGLYVRAVEIVSRGKFWGPREAVALMAERVADDKETEPTPADDRLDAEGLRLLALLNEGLSNKEIGQRLGLAEATIKARFNRLYKRFGVATRLQLLTAALREGLIRSDRP